ncbi:MAG: DNA-packaging protein [Mogibacterium sp.]|nr:DNA-packaging protein [Mogibacterium sp.]
MANQQTIDKVKLALRVVTSAFDSEIDDLIDAGLADMGIAGITEDDDTNALILRAVITYCRVNFGSPEDYDRLKASYDEQKAQLQMATGFTDWEA